MVKMKFFSTKTRKEDTNMSDILLFANKALLLLACHVLGDYGLQNAWMAALKGKEWHPLFAHVTTYTAVFTLCLAYPSLSLRPCALLFLLCSHLLIDICKARLNLISDLADQGLHLLCLGVVLAMGWI